MDKHIIWLELWDNDKSKEMFSGSGKIPVSLYILHNIVNNTEKTTTITSKLNRLNLTYHNIYLNPKQNIPFAYFTIYAKLNHLLQEKPELKIDVLRRTVKGNGESLGLPQKYSAGDRLGVITYLVKPYQGRPQGFQVKKMATIHPDSAKLKLIIANKMSFTGSLVEDGKLGLIGNNKFYILGDNIQSLTRLQQLFNTKLAELVCNSTKYHMSFLDPSAFGFLPDVRKIPIKELPIVDDLHLAKYLGLSPEDTQLIKKKIEAGKL